MASGFSGIARVIPENVRKIWAVETTGAYRIDVG
jgi:hypothetical protein